MKDIRIQKNGRDWWVEIDGEDFVSLARLHQLRAKHLHHLDLPGIWGPDGDGSRGKAPRDPLMLYLFLGYNAQDLEAPTLKISFSRAVRELMDRDSMDPGYENCPGIKAMRDQMAKLVDELDAWDRKR